MNLLLENSVLSIDFIIVCMIHLCVFFLKCIKCFILSFEIHDL